MLDEKLKTKILENYEKTLELPKQKRMQKVKGVVQQLNADGLYEEADKYLDNTSAMLKHSYSDAVDESQS
jgi:hypothetical protein